MNSLANVLYGDEVEREFDTFASSCLSEETSVRSIALSETSGDVSDVILNEQHILSPMMSERAEYMYNCLFVNRFLVKKRHTILPSAAKKLHISKTALRRIFSIFDLLSTFIQALSRFYFPSGRGLSNRYSNGANLDTTLWHILPIRMQVKCMCQIMNDPERNQFNPLHHLHLPDPGIDIRGSMIALVLRHTKGGKLCSVVAISFIDGRWPKTVQEPETRIKEVLGDNTDRSLKDDPFFIQLVYLISVARWWTNALSSIHNQLIAYDFSLQNEDEAQRLPSAIHQDTNRALHAMAAHLHRYASELKTLDETTTAIIGHHPSIITCKARTSDATFQAIEDGLTHVQSQIKAVIDFEMELEKKIQNSLALLFNRIQLSNDRVVVANGAAMQAIMQASQEETKVSRVLATKAHKLSESMRKDSLSMRTIAACTMLFLPGTSFAAILSMPFFDSNLKDPPRFWLWVVLTVPSTVIAFAFYFWRQSRNNAKKEMSIEMSP